jgi:hypothetical protein
MRRTRNRFFPAQVLTQGNGEAAATGGAAAAAGATSDAGLRFRPVNGSGFPKGISAPNVGTYDCQHNHQHKQQWRWIAAALETANSPPRAAKNGEACLCVLHDKLSDLLQVHLA